MTAALNVPVDPALLERLDALAAARETTREALVEMALVGFLERPTPPDDDDYALEQIMAGLAEADRGEFASDADVDRVFRKYRP